VVNEFEVSAGAGGFAGVVLSEFGAGLAVLGFHGVEIQAVAQEPDAVTADGKSGTGTFNRR
jgi:hypothetical protein